VKQASNAKVRTAIVGCGGWGRSHVESFRAIPNVEIVALCDVDRSRVRAYQDNYFAAVRRKPAGYTSFKTMLARAQFDAVALVTPHAVHYEHAAAALKAGLHVLIEKPMVTIAEQARTLVALADARQRILAIGYQGLCSPEFAYMRRILKRGDIGNVEFVHAFAAQDWRRHTLGSWRHDPTQSGGGQLIDTGAHVLIAVLWLVDAPPSRVFVTTRNSQTPVDVNAAVTIEFKNGVLASIGIAGNALGRMDSQLGIYGTNGSLVSGVWGDWLRHTDSQGQEIRYPVVPYEPLTPQQNFINAIRRHDTLRCPARYGIVFAELVEAIYASVESGMPEVVGQRRAPSKTKKRRKR
jgi:predicted dehydrogenase